jgi:hypothetical protein
LYDSITDEERADALAPYSYAELRNLVLSQDAEHWSHYDCADHEAAVDMLQAWVSPLAAATPLPLSVRVAPTVSAPSFGDVINVTNLGDVSNVAKVFGHAATDAAAAQIPGFYVEIPEFFQGYDACHGDLRVQVHEPVAAIFNKALVDYRQCLSDWECRRQVTDDAYNAAHRAKATARKLTTALARAIQDAYCRSEHAWFDRIFQLAGRCAASNADESTSCESDEDAACME